MPPPYSDMFRGVYFSWKYEIVCICVLGLVGEVDGMRSDVMMN